MGLCYSFDRDSMDTIGHQTLCNILVLVQNKSATVTGKGINQTNEQTIDVVSAKNIRVIGFNVQVSVYFLTKVCGCYLVCFSCSSPFTS